jgi:hypothetical protein
MRLLEDIAAEVLAILTRELSSVTETHTVYARTRNEPAKYESLFGAEVVSVTIPPGDMKSAQFMIDDDIVKESDWIAVADRIKSELSAAPDRALFFLQMESPVGLEVAKVGNNNATIRALRAYDVKHDQFLTCVDLMWATATIPINVPSLQAP